MTWRALSYAFPVVRSLQRRAIKAIVLVKNGNTMGGYSVSRMTAGW